MDGSPESVQFNWNTFPSSRLEISQLPSPIGCLYSPLSTNDVASISTEDSLVSCRTCGGYLNPYITKDVSTNIWKCPFCLRKSYFPTKDFPVPQATSFEAIVPTDIAQGFNEDTPENIIFVLDTYQHIDELNHDSNSESSFSALIDSLVEAIEKLSDGVLVTLITFDESVHFHQPLISTQVSFSQEELFKQSDYNLDALFLKNSTVVKQAFHKLKLLNRPKWSPQDNSLTKEHYSILLDTTTKQQLQDYLQSLKPKITQSYKPPRSLGLCLYLTSIALSMGSYLNFNGRVFLFVSGPNNSQPGAVIHPGQSLRSHHDIKQLNSNSNYISTLKYYEAISFLANGLPLDSALQMTGMNQKTTSLTLAETLPKWTINIFTGSLDQVGLYEMKSLILNTNGDVLISNGFNDQQFKDQFKKTIQGVASNVSRATLTVTTSPNLKVTKMISHTYHLPPLFANPARHHDTISDQLTKFDSKYKKHYFTNKWHWNNLQSTDSLAIFFEIEGLKSSKDIPKNGSEYMYIQFKLKYWDKVEKTWKVRITTVRKPTTLRAMNIRQVKNLQLNLNNAKIDLLQNLDSSAWITLFCRLMISKLDTNIGFEFEGLVKQMDLCMVKLLNNFNKAVIDGDKINEKLTKLPSLMYSLRKNPQLIQIFNASPDETTYYHHWFMKFGLDLAPIAIQPKMYQLHGNTEIEIPLDSNIIERVPSKTFLVLDSVFNIIIYYHYDKADEETKLKLHHSENQDLVFDSQLTIPMDFISNVLKVQNRPIVPKYIITQTNHSQARFLTSRLNPPSIANGTSLIEDNSKPWYSRLFSGGGGNNNHSSSFNYDISKTDECSYNAYYKSLIKLIRNYRLDDDS